VLHEFDGGDGRIGIHGRGASSLLDPLGSAHSHGCIRLSNTAIDWLVHTIGPGQLPCTPVQIDQKGTTMIERIDDMPPGTIGFRAKGKLTRDDYRNILEPVLHEAAESGEIRMLFALTAFEGLEPAAWFDDIKTGLGLGIGHHSAWKRSAIVTDMDWIGRAYRMFAWMTPGEVKVYGLDQLEEAKSWVSA